MNADMLHVLCAVECVQGHVLFAFCFWLLAVIFHTLKPTRSENICKLGLSFSMTNNNILFIYFRTVIYANLIYFSIFSIFLFGNLQMFVELL